ncbi:uncharacterized protein LOC118272869 [Spodoptera frugiperda]|uniref:ATP-dependent DNA helicase n=1 Tax=Spodoptera frugiperda TaxID=7108 RepID=A0A9R0D9K8_SPOFR|nr:uncharacterized protein LOC118272869 [Spodoptera frugiperda]
MYAKIETERLVYIRSNQRQLRAEEYVHLRDAMQQDNDTVNMGRLVILPSSFTGGPRYMHERTQDAFCYVRKYGRPDLFITVTTNPKWAEITRELLEGQAPHDRHDIIARVFHLKLKSMIHLLTKDNIFGEVLCYMYSVEWQKRGLPHAHILLWLKDKVRPNDVDSSISAEIPDPIADPLLYDIVKTHMIHGPCGAFNRNAPCMQDGRCSKRYPKALVDETVTGHDGYPLYRRRSRDNGGFIVEKRVSGQQVTLDNRWVVPYSPVLSRTFQAHINVEICNSVQSIKYICKYINKGSDQATFALRNEHDEVTRFQSGRYISSSEAVWRILSFNIHERYPPVTHLDVHLEGGQRIYFNAENVTERLENPRQTTLLAFFRLCQIDDFAKSLLYEEVPSYYTYDKQRGVFNRRRRGRPVEGESDIFKEHVLGRVYTVHPNNAECFFLRLLLHTVRGPTSFIDLKKVDDIVYPTYHAACQARHLLENDQHWDDALAESCVSDNPRRLRHLFVTLLTFCNLSDAVQLWEKYKEKFAEDFLRNMSHNDEGANNFRDLAINQCLLALQEDLTAVGGKSLCEYGLPTPTSVGQVINSEYSAEIGYNSMELLATLENGVPMMTAEQRTVYDRVCESVQNDSGTMWFLDAPGGTGKTFLTKLILAYVRNQRKIALAVASSGIAATLLPGGKTAHTMFKIPIDLDRTESPTCSISRNSDKARVLRDCNLIIWDECTMAHRKGVEAVDRTLRDIRQNDRPMGGITVLFCGDFRQTLPVIPRGTRADEVRACLKSSYLWRDIQSVHLTINMRVRTGDNPDDRQFSDTLLKIGEDTYPRLHQGKLILTPELCCIVQSQEHLISSVYGDVTNILNRDNSWLCERSILTPRNDQASEINNKILANIQGESKVYCSINRMVDEQEATNYPIEFLNSLNMPGLPSHEICLKIGIPIILLRNLRPPKLCNGTRLKVTQLQQNIIEAQILTGCGAGETVFIPRIPIIPNNFPFQFKRTQFPVSVCYAMTINKAQGQTLRVAGVDLSVSCFSHGQLYVGLSRVSSSRNLYVHVPDGSTFNIVYPEALR